MMNTFASNGNSKLKTFIPFNCRSGIKLLEKYYNSYIYNYRNEKSQVKSIVPISP